jgi:hypothetical protein
MNILKQIYRYIVDHLTKALGAAGGTLMTVALMDPAPIRDAAQTYLGQHSAAKVGAVLFGLVILRGWYTGQKAKQAQTLPAPDPNASRP